MRHLAGDGARIRLVIRIDAFTFRIQFDLSLSPIFVGPCLPAFPLFPRAVGRNFESARLDIYPYAPPSRSTVPPLGVWGLEGRPCTGQRSPEN
jgi:hypothetical protein